MRRKVWKSRWDSPTWITRSWLKVALYRDYPFDNLSNNAQRSIFLAAGQAGLAINNPGAIYQGTVIYISFLLLAVAGLMISVVMLWSNIFSRITAYVGILASAFDLAYCITFAFMLSITVYLLSASGLLLMIWHILIGLRLF